MKKFRTAVLFGEKAVRIYENHSHESTETVEQELNDSGVCFEYKEAEFNTEAERQAYLKGILDAFGWNGYIVLDDKEKLLLSNN